MKLGTQYATLGGTLLAVIMLGAISLNYRVMSTALEQRQEAWAGILVGALSEGMARDIIEQRQLQLRATLEKIADDSEDLRYAFVTDFEGRVLAHSFPDGFPRVLLPEVDLPRDGLSRRVHEVDGVSVQEVAFPVVTGMNARLHLGISRQGNAELLARMSGLFALFAAGIGFVGVVLSLRLGRRIARPLEQLAENVARYGATGRVPVMVDERDCDEARQLKVNFHDMIAARELADAALRRHAEKLGEAQRLAHVGSWELDLTVGRLEWSDEIFRLFEIDQTKFAATYEAFLNAIHPEDREAVNQAYGQSLQDQQPYEITHRLQMPDGRIKWVQERCTSTFDAEGKPLRSVGTVQDITPQYQAEQALAQLNQELEQRVAQRTAESEAARKEAERASLAKSEFLSRMSHELRTPLNAILGFGQLLVGDDERPLAPEHQENVQEMLQAGHHLLELVNEMLDLSRIESGHLDLQMEPVVVRPMLEECLALVRPLAKQRQIGLHLTETPCVLQVDRLRLRQVLLNLLSNAIKYNREGGRVDVTCHPAPDGRVRLEVRDSGQGIAPENLARLFKPFERLESAYKGIEGAGIGLALTRRLVEGMGGEVGVHSVLGEGSTFWVSLPAAVLLPAPAAPAAAATSHAPCRVLYVEDNPINIKVMAQVFAQRPQLGLHTVRSAEEGLVWARAEHPDLILMDINLPGMDGYQALAALKADAATAAIPVLAVSANAMQGDRERGLAAGFVDYVAKPLDVPRFLDLLMRWCTDARPKQGEGK